jgi:hypothetical protein
MLEDICRSAIKIELEKFRKKESHFCLSKIHTSVFPSVSTRELGGWEVERSPQIFLPSSFLGVG